VPHRRPFWLPDKDLPETRQSTPVNARFKGDVVVVGGFAALSCAVAVYQRAVAMSDDDLMRLDVVQTG
jgi:hypothetical protein